MSKRRKTEKATEAAGEVLLHGTGGEGDEAPGERSAVARRVAKTYGISVRAAKKKVRDLVRVQLGKLPERAGRRVRKTWDRTIDTLAKKTSVDSPEEAVRRLRAMLDRLRGRVLVGGVGGKSGTQDDRIFREEAEAHATATASSATGTVEHHGTSGAAYAPAGKAEPAPAAGATYTVELEPAAGEGYIVKLESAAGDYTVDADPGTRDSVAEADGGVGGKSGTRDDR